MWRDVQRRCQIREYRLPEAPRRAVMYMIAGGGRWEPGAKVFVRQWLSEKPVLRYSIVHPHRIVDPPNGRIPPLARATLSRRVPAARRTNGAIKRFSPTTVHHSPPSPRPRTGVSGVRPPRRRAKVPAPLVSHSPRTAVQLPGADRKAFAPAPFDAIDPKRCAPVTLAEE
jgi:hypothetical protein